MSSKPEFSRAGSVVRFAIVETDGRMRKALAQSMGGVGRVACRGIYSDYDQALARITEEPVDVVLIGIDLHKRPGLECVLQLKARLPRIQVLVHSEDVNRERVFAVFEAGADGYLLKRTPAQEILNAIEEVHRGGSPLSGSIARKIVHALRQRGEQSREVAALSRREREIMGLVARGYHNKQIAVQMGISLETVRVHLRNIYEKLKVGSRSEALVKFLGAGAGAAEVAERTSF